MAEPQIAEAVPQVSFKKRSNKSNFRKRAATPPPASDSDSGFTSSEDESGHRVKRRRKTAGVTATSIGAKSAQSEGQEQQTNSTSGPTVLKPSDDATKTSNWYEPDPKFLLGNSKNSSTEVSSAPDGIYKGAANYSNFIQKNPDSLQSKTVGPVKQASNVRTITVTDFAPDVCKDYKTTGFCGFGDSCKFLHAREDYKQGWELDRDWEIGTKSGKKNVQGKVVASANRNKDNSPNGDEEDEALLESIPFACVICKRPYTNPIVTKCGHYFCETCALQRYRKKPDCAACGAGTGGVFNVAKKLKVLLERKRERARRRREKARENGEEVNSGEEADVG